MNKPSRAERLRYAFDNFMARGTRAHGVTINPPKSERLALRDGDAVIVLAE